MNILHITTELVNTPTKQLYHIDIFISNGLYKITTESIKLVLDVKQFGASSNLIVHIHDVQKVSFSSSTILVKTSHGFCRNSIEHFQPRIQIEV